MKLHELVTVDIRPTEHPAGCVYGGFTCGYWLIADNCDLPHPEVHHVTDDRCPCGHTFPDAGTGTFLFDAALKDET